MRLRAAMLLAACLLAGCGGIAAPERHAPVAVPQRIVSMNPCVDAILMEVADPDRIAAISHYSHDPRATSIPLAQALRFPAVSDAAEDVIAARPDLVIAGPHVALPTMAALERLGIEVMTVGVPASIAESKAQIADVARRVGHPGRGAVLNARIDAALAAARPDGGAPVSALIWQGGGLVPGTGTLADDMMLQTGFRNISTDLGLAAWDMLSLEGLLASPPSLVLAGISGNMDGSGGEGRRTLGHPALRKAGARIRIADFPPSLLHCGGPVIVRALARLAEVRRQEGGKAG